MKFFFVIPDDLSVITRLFFASRRVHKVIQVRGDILVHDGREYLDIQLLVFFKLRLLPLVGLFTSSLSMA